MVLTNCPLSSFAVCADPNAGAREQARARQKQKEYEFRGNSLKYWNKETDYVKGKEQIATGYSRDMSDIQQALSKTRGAAFTQYEGIARKQAMEGFVDEGGSSATAGRNQAIALLAKRAEVEQKIYNFETQGVAQAQRGASLRRDSQVAKNRAKLGMLPQFGDPVMMPPKDTVGQIMNAAQFGLQTATSIAALAAASDIRLKENIEQVDISLDGHKIYEFNYKNNPTRYRGAMAQDVVKIDPMAVGIHNNYLTVDYSKIDVDMEVIG
tara:strand:+ start:103 stop:903 length:801 start_codon:yes stop_codon:yes gene_type:complete